MTSGRGGLSRVEVETSLASAEIYLQGAHVTAYAPRDGAPVLFLSRASRFEPGAPIRGGIPLVFPWFGRKAGDPSAPLHGPARLAEWRLEEAVADPADVVTLRFALADLLVDAESARARLGYQVTVGRSLQLALAVENRGPAPFAFEDALHTYLAVADVERVALTGLEKATFLDETDGFARKRQDATPLVVRGETDRIYDDTRSTCVVWDPVERRRIAVAKTGSEATVVWNPSAACVLPDLGAAEWTRFLCVESGNVGARAITLAPGARHRLTVDLSSEPWNGA